MRDMNYAPAEGMQPNAPTLHSTATTLLLRVKGGRTHNEQIFSAQPLGADFVRRSLHFADAIEYEIVSLSKGTSLAQRLQTEAQALGRSLKLRIQVRSFDAMCNMVAAGLGVAVLPRDAIAPHLRSMNLKQIAIDDAWASRRLLIGLRDAAAVPRHVRLLIDQLCTPADPVRPLHRASRRR